MIWTFTKWHYGASTSRITRWWLRMTAIDKFVITAVVALLAFIISLFSFLGGFSYWLSANLPKFAFAFFIFFIVDLIWNFFVTQNDFVSMEKRDDVLLATRCEYIGGHPELPDSRFVYFTLGGTKTKPVLSIIFSQFDDDKYAINLIDITDTKSSIDDKFGKPGGLNVALTGVTPSIWKGYRSTLIVEFVKAGRKYKAEFGSFSGGNDEVQKWKNYITCIMAEADTGTKPFGEWKSLPETKQKKPANKSGKINP